MQRWIVQNFRSLSTGAFLVLILGSVKAWMWCDRLSLPTISQPRKTEASGDSGLGHFQNHAPLTGDDFPSLQELQKEMKGAGFHSRASIEEVHSARKQFQDGHRREGLLVMESLARAQNAPSLMVAVARALAIEGDQAKATELLNSDIAKRMNPATLGEAYMTIGDLQQASIYLEQALSAPSPQIATFINLSTVYWSSGQNARSRSVVENGMKHYPKKASLFYALGQTYLGEAVYDKVADEGERRKLILKGLSAYKTAMNLSLNSPLERIAAINNVGLAVHELGLDSTAAQYWSFDAELCDKHKVKHAPLLLNLGNQMLIRGGPGWIAAPAAVQLPLRDWRHALSRSAFAPSTSRFKVGRATG